jgi:TolB-like protein/Tfp pilus assembly protein PilF/predicted Ser/Thr protein kinase
LIGQTLSHYRITAKLGEGGMGEVYLAEDEKLERKVALKVLPAELAADPDRLRRLQREAKALAALDHPSIVTVFSVEEESGRHFLTMAHVEGEDLDDLIPEEGFAVERLLELAIPLTDALRAAHERGIVHRDLKPGNVMVDSEGRLRVLDFGLARREIPAGPEDETQLATQTMTQAGTVLGTYPYMSPEQAQGQVADARSDLFSLGVMLYEMATGQRPFSGETGVSLVSSILKDTPLPVTDLKKGLPAELGAIIEKCLEKEPAARFASAEELRERLQAVRRQVEVGITVPTRRRQFVLTLVLATVMIVAGVTGWQTLIRGERSSDAAQSEAAGPRIASLAVLPLRNFSGDAEQEYFVDGMTEALITDLSKIGAPKVISRTSAMQYKATEKSLAEIAEELGVEAVIEGSVLREGGRVGITAQLIEVATDETLWAERYTRDLTSILALQGEIAQAIAGEIRVTLTPQEESLLSSAREVDPDAYDAVVKGRYHIHRFTPQDFQVALKYFESAIEIDPEYAPAHVGVSRFWTFSMQAGFVSQAEGAPRGLAAIQKALELDSTSAEAHLLMAVVQAWGRWDWKEAEAEFLRSIELDPGFAEARIFFSHLLSILGRHEDASSQAEKALDLDPLNPFFQALHGVQMTMSGRFDEARERFRQTFEANPGLGFGHLNYGTLLSNQGELALALEQIKVEYAGRGDREIVAVLEREYASVGYEGAMRAAAEVLISRPATSHAQTVRIALLYEASGDTEKALEWLERGLGEHDPNMPYIDRLGFSDNFRSDVRFQDLLRRMKLPATHSS